MKIILSAIDILKLPAISHVYLNHSDANAKGERKCANDQQHRDDINESSDEASSDGIILRIRICGSTCPSLYSISLFYIGLIHDDWGSFGESYFGFF